MTYNIHPIFVHIPIAFLAIYSIITIFQFDRYIKKIAWRDIKLLLILVGVIGAGLSLMTGEMSEHLLRPAHDIVEMHALFAQITTWTYAILLLGEMGSWYIRNVVGSVQLESTDGTNIEKTFRLKKVAQVLHTWVMSPYIATTLSVIALIALVLTGVLGGVMVHGVSADPISPFVLNLLGL